MNLFTKALPNVTFQKLVYEIEIQILYDIKLAKHHMEFDVKERI